jgi:hypothetical protein
MRMVFNKHFSLLETIKLPVHFCVTHTCLYP